LNKLIISCELYGLNLEKFWEITHGNTAQVGMVKKKGWFFSTYYAKSIVKLRKERRLSEAKSE
jgi:hypothetical protein